MAPNTAFQFFLLGLLLLLINYKSRRTLGQALAVVVCFGAILPITGYAYGVHSFQGLASFIPMALHTATTFLVLALGLFFAAPDSDLAEVFAAKDTRGILARQLFPLAVLVTFFLGWLRVWIEKNGWVESAFGTALLCHHAEYPTDRACPLDRNSGRRKWKPLAMLRMRDSPQRTGAKTK